MSLQETNLPGFVMANLYGKSLVITESIQVKQKLDESTAAAPQPSAGKLNFLGSNEKKITIVVSYTDQVFLPDEQLSFLSAVLQACKLNLADISIVNLYNTTLTHQALREKLDFKHLLLFGVSADSIGLAAANHFVPRAEGGFSLMESPALELLNKASDEAKLLKSKLWLSLKQMLLA